jgi:hypothetical protein
MQTLSAFHSFISAALILACSTATADVNDTANERRLSIPASSRTIVLPREDWTIVKEMRKAGDTGFYYMLTSQRRQMFFSVYIDRTDNCRSAQACLDTAMANASYKNDRDVRRSDVNQFKVAQFALDSASGPSMKQANVSASAYIDGLWFDVHISKVGAETPELAPLLDFLQTVSIK